MKTIEEKAEIYAKHMKELRHQGQRVSVVMHNEDYQAEGYIGGFKDAQEFIPIEEEFPPYNEDILIQTHRGSIYFGKMREGGMRYDFFTADLSEETVRLSSIKSWRPIFYK